MPIPTNAYEYKPLGNGEIRILYLQPGVLSDSIMVEICHEKLSDLKKGKSPYWALSWRWGGPPVGGEIGVKELFRRGTFQDKTWTLPARPNLVAALKHLRDEREIKRLWVDALCIHQTNDKEKSSQIGMMTSIYNTAQEVHVWLGEESGDSEKAMGFVRKLVNLGDNNHIAGLGRGVFDESKPGEIRALLNLLKREWFSRRWVVQEIAMARYAIFHCGKESVTWTDLAVAIALLEKVSRDWSINRILKQTQDPSQPPDYLGHISSLPAYRLVQNTTAMFRGQDEENGGRTWRRTLEELVSYLAAFEALNLHDTIYAILGIASDFGAISHHEQAATLATGETPSSDNDDDGVPRPYLARSFTAWLAPEDRTKFEVNYELDPLVVFKRFLDQAIKNSKSLDIICRPWAPSEGIDAHDKVQSITLPSWIAPLQKKPYRPNGNRDMVRYNPDPLVGAVGNTFYRASDREEPKYKIPDVESPHSSQLQAYGFVLGQIKECWDASQFGNVPGSWLAAGGWKDETKPPRDELWRTLVADRNAAGSEPERWYPLAFQSAVKDRGISFGFETARLIHESNNTAVSELFRRVQQVVWNRRLVRVKGEFNTWLRGGAPGAAAHPGALSLAPGDARQDDYVCVLFGCSVPLVLREVKRPVAKEAPEPTPPVRPTLNGAAAHIGALLNGAMAGSMSSDASTPLGSEAAEVALDAMEPDGDAPVPNAAGEPLAKPAATKGVHFEMLEDEDKVYELVGECYVDHMMDGEAVSFYKKKQLQKQWFIIE